MSEPDWHQLETVRQDAAELPAWTRLYERNTNMSQNFDDLYPSKYLKQSDVEGQVTVTIESVKKVNMARDGEEPEYKPVIKFREYSKPMVLNKTNGTRIAERYGRDITEWAGNQMVLYVNPDVTFGNETKGGLRLKPPTITKQRKPSSDDDFNREMSGDNEIPF